MTSCFRNLRVAGVHRLSASLLALSGMVCAQTGGTILKNNTFPEIDIRTFQNTYLPGTIDIPGTINNDRGIQLGGVGSGLWHSRQHDPDDTYWMLTDRGPQPSGTSIFPLRNFTPFILHVKAEQNGSITILSAMPLVGASGNGTTGLPNLITDQN